ncbi:MAG: DnaJ domain-containing protein [Caldilineaceae bacterium SB0675_bin_29]|uniref:DnaJ domain-containing protein n=1 Tax=Caldilineaceae bacterium SB0675_bin_29 TaxID=2605266 RepID=A0A6B1G0H5_9CHLR|nr:DnaJ domain-containing protein [Caldilineaceae bacterium SB0675_bin_29]
MSDDSNQADKELYRTLDLSEDADQEEVTQQFIRLQKLYQPDTLESAADRAYAEQKLTEIEKAYEILGDPARRAIYDGRPAPIQVGSDGEPESLTCANHPDRETLLRCNKCGKPICISCAVRTPVGYRCNECVREQQNIYFNALGRDNIVALAVGFVLTLIVAPIVGFLLGSIGFFGFFIAFIIGSGAGTLAARIIRSAVGNRRGRKLPHMAIAGIILGVAPWALLFLLSGGRAFLMLLLFAGLTIASAFPQLR